MVRLLDQLRDRPDRREPLERELTRTLQMRRVCAGAAVRWCCMQDGGFVCSECERLFPEISESDAPGVCKDCAFECAECGSTYAACDESETLEGVCWCCAPDPADLDE